MLLLDMAIDGPTGAIDGNENLKKVYVPEKPVYLAKYASMDHAVGTRNI